MTSNEPASNNRADEEEEEEEKERGNKNDVAGAKPLSCFLAR
jgi:hypothetical protein